MCFIEANILPVLNELQFIYKIDRNVSSCISVMRRASDFEWDIYEGGRTGRTV